MNILKILETPDPRLKLRAEPVAQVDDAVRKVMEDMWHTMQAHDGVGLAAIQVGITQRIIVINLTVNNKTYAYKMANPEIIWRSQETAFFEEGCLSVPDQYAQVARPQAIQVNYLDESNLSHTLEATGVLADCLQHEIDHLDGILFIDHLSRLKRDIILKKLYKARRFTA